MKKLLTAALSLTIACASIVGFTGCNGTTSTFKPVAKEDLKIGMITLHDNTSTYDKNFIEAMQTAVEEMGLDASQLKLVSGVDEKEECYDTAKSMVNQGCQLVFADSFGHEDYLIQAANEFPGVHFCHATGTKAHSVKLDNFSNAFASIYEGRYLAGVAAGMKLNELANGSEDASDYVMGYVGAFPYEEVVSGYTSFYLGAKSVCDKVTMKVRYSGSWFDYDTEYDLATKLINEDGCKLISQHADSYGAPTACEENGVPNVSYNGSTKSVGANTYIVSSRINWVPYFKYIIQQTLDGKKVDTDWTGTMKNGSVEILEVNEDVAAAGTTAKLAEVKAKLLDGTLHVFDTATFTVGGKKLADGTLADVDSDANYTADTAVVKNGVFEESKYRSAPYFGVRIDGITELTA